MLSSHQFDRTRRLALSLAGIELVDRHRGLLGSRCRRLGLCEAGGLDAVLSAAEAGDRTASQQVVGLVTTSYTGFFRHPGQFDLAVQHTLRTVERHGVARLWSAAAATGEEPYSLALALLEHCRRDDPPVMILATDINQDALELAVRGEYREAALTLVGPDRRARWFGQPAGAGRWRIAAPARSLVAFQRLNLADTRWSVDGPFDVIFCRNVLMYLEDSHRHAALARMAAMLAPDGWLFLDPTEHAGKAAHLFTAGLDGAYRRCRGCSPPGRTVPCPGSHDTNPSRTSGGTEPWCLPIA